MKGGGRRKTEIVETQFEEKKLPQKIQKVEKECMSIFKYLFNYLYPPSPLRKIGIYMLTTNKKERKEEKKDCMLMKIMTDTKKGQKSVVCIRKGRKKDI